MNKPDYHGSNILNLISTIETALGSKSKYKLLRLLNPSELKDSRNIVLILIDGLGYEFLMKNGRGTAFNENLRGKMTSVFPSSTSAAIPALMTGLSTQEHGMTGWYMHMKEFSSTIIPLPYIHKLGGESSLKKIVEIKNIFNIKPLANRIKVKSYLIQGNKILNSDFTITAAGRSKRIGYNTMHEYFRAIKKLLYKKERKYIFAYYPKHDLLCHHKGSTSKQTLNHFKKLSKALSSFIKSIKGTNTTIIITADHGIIEVDKSRLVELSDHPRLRETLVMPLCGEHRFAYAYVKMSKEKEFRNYIETYLSHCCTLVKSEDLLKKGYFGLFDIYKEFKNRIGDYILIMKDNWAIYDRFIHKNKKSYNIGDHGGLSNDELYVPLIVIKR